MSAEVSLIALTIGSEGDDVLLVQQVLNHYGYGHLEEDGIFGFDTEAAVQNYQSDRELEPDGIVGPSTWDSIIYDAQQARLIR